MKIDSLNDHELTWDEFSKVELRVGTIIRAEPFPKARNPAYIVWVDCGQLGEFKSSAQITVHYELEELIGKQVVCVLNFPEKQIGPIKSQCLVTGFYDEQGVVLAVPDKPCPNGTKLC